MAAASSDTLGGDGATVSGSTVTVTAVGAVGTAGVEGDGDRRAVARTRRRTQTFRVSVSSNRSPDTVGTLRALSLRMEEPAPNPWRCRGPSRTGTATH